MHDEDLSAFVHDHDHGLSVAANERRTRWVVVLTAAMMIAELVVGTVTRSMALTADGWHMATHAGALGMSALAYWFARTRSRESSFTFGTGKVYALAGYTSAVVLGLVALLMMVESARRLIFPVEIRFGEALPVAVIGLLVNLASVRLLHPGGAHAHDDDHDHSPTRDGGGEPPRPHDHGHDHNMRAAYFHVLADALTSVLAIAALLAGRYLGWTFLDATMGLVGGAVILNWGVGLCRGAARQLLDVVPSAEIAQAIKRSIEAIDDARVADLHLWEIAPGKRSCIVSLVTSTPRAPASYREAVLAAERSIAHVTIEVQSCSGIAPEDLPLRDGRDAP